MRDVIQRHLKEWWDAPLFVLGSVALWAFGISLVGDFRIDDAYITFAYSKNLADGRGPIYGYDMRVEGYSNFLWMVLVALGQALGAGALATARFLGHASFALLLASAWLLVRKLGGKFAALLVVLCLAGSSDFHRALQSGLESVAYAAFLSAGLCHYVLEDPKNRRWSGVWFCLAAFVRIDGVVALGLVFGLDLVRIMLDGPRPNFRTWVRWTALAVLPVAAYWLFRSWYYGLLFPLPYYAKATLGMEAERQGANYVWRFFEDSGLWVFLLVGVMGLSKTKEKGLLVLGAVSASVIGYVVHVGGDWMPFNRMLLPVISPLTVVAGVGVGQLVPTFSSLRNVRTALAALLCAGGAAYVGAHLNQNWVMTPHEQRKLAEVEHSRTHTQNLLKAYPFIQALIRKPGDKLVTDYGGVFSYGTKATVIEMWGLCNKDIALQGNTDGVVAIYGKTCVPCYADFQPDYFHVNVPLLRDRNALRTRHQVISGIFQGWALDRVLDLRNKYRPGRVTDSRTGETLWFLERIRDDVSFEKRQVGVYEIDYPRMR